jgi:hypothetical protein
MRSVGTSVRIPAAPTVRAIRAKGLLELLVVVGRDDERTRRTHDRSHPQHRARLSFSASATVDGVTVEIPGIQFSDGTIERHILTAGDGLEQMTAAQARRFAVLLVDAADELDRLND